MYNMVSIVVNTVLRNLTLQRDYNLCVLTKKVEIYAVKTRLVKLFC